MSFGAFHLITHNFGLFMSLQIEDGDLFAIIDQKDGMVRFLENPEQYKSCEMIERIDSSIKRYLPP